MGMYTGIRFKGIVKPEFRRNFKEIALEGAWEESRIHIFKSFGINVGRSSFIPCGSLSYMPDAWGQVISFDDGFENYKTSGDTDGFDRTYDEETGRWTFQCSLKNYENEIESFFELIPEFIESIEHLEYFYEEWKYSEKYDLVNGKVTLVEPKFINYGL